MVELDDLVVGLVRKSHEVTFFGASDRGVSGDLVAQSLASEGVTSAQSVESHLVSSVRLAVS